MAPYYPQGVVLVATLVVLFIGFADAACYSDADCPSKPNAYSFCTDGTCSYQCMSGGWLNCDDDMITNGCEVNSFTDVFNCGSCGRWCIPYHPDTVISTCEMGECVYKCKEGLSDCNDWLRDGCESRLPYNNDLRFCGSCTTPCLMDLPNAVSECILGKCYYTCNPGFENCDNDWTNGCEIDLSTNVNNCKTCNNKCKYTLDGGEATCSQGKCGQQCKKNSKYDDNKKKCVPTY